MEENDQASDILSEVFRSSLKRYEKVCKLLEEDLKKDPESEPYRSQYAAREILAEVKADLAKFVDSGELITSADVHARLNTLLAAINYHLGVICVETEEFSAGEELLVKCYDLLIGAHTPNESHSLTNADAIEIEFKGSLSRERILVAMLTLNELGILWSMRGDLKRSAMYLERSERLCKTYRSKVGLAPYDVKDLFVFKSLDAHDLDDASLESNWKIFEKTFTHTMYYMAQIYSGLQEVTKAAAYCHMTLRRQLEAAEVDQSDSNHFDAVDWAVNAATLSQFFITKNNFSAARHHLACAVHVLDQHEAKVMAMSKSSNDFNNAAEDENQTEQGSDLIEKIKHRQADVAICWGKYAIALLAASWERLLGQETVSELADNLNNAAMVDQQDESTEGETDIWQALQDEAWSSKDKPQLIFDSLEVTSIEEQMTANFILDFDQGRSLFLAGQKWLNLAKGFYTLETYALDHAEIIRDISRLYRNLIHFESNESRCCKLHKRRVHMLEAELSAFNPKYYLGVCRQLQFELAETYSEMMLIKLNILQEYSDSESSSPSETESNNSIKKINHLISQSMMYFRAYLDTYRDKNGEMPEKYPDDDVRPLLLAHFFIARLHSKLIVPETSSEKIDQLHKSIEQYQFVFNYCERNPSAAEDMKEEVWICKEMIELLPKKLDRILLSL